MKKKVLLLILVALSAFIFLGCPQPTDGNDGNGGNTNSATTINLKAIAGVTAPVTGAAPVTSITANAQYTGTVTWSPDASEGFKANETYTATITLKAKKGYTLTGVSENFFKVEGATATNDANSGVVKAVFSETLRADIVSSNIGNLKAVPAGRFQRDEELQNISVITKPYYMSQYQITRAQFKAVMGEDPSDLSRTTGENDPVQNVNWYHAIAFCNKLSIKEGKDPVYTVSGISNWVNLAFSSIPTDSDTDWDAATQELDKNGYRLPTEMEWMWAAMGAPTDGQNGGINKTGYSKVFAGSTGSNSIDDYAWYYDKSENKTHPVGEKYPNELGIFDLSGNVWEWCWDWYASYLSGTQDDYLGAASGTFRVTRGGSFHNSAFICTVAYRDYYSPSSQKVFYGFRVVCSGD